MFVMKVPSQIRLQCIRGFCVCIKQNNRKYLEMDIISKLPSNIIETILCFLPIQEAAKTSILSKEWRYHWIKIPKLEFIEDTFRASIDGIELQQLLKPCQKRDMIRRHKLYNAIQHVLLWHEASIHEFTLSMVSNASCFEIESIMRPLSWKNTVKKLKLQLISGSKLPLTIFTFHQLTDLHLTGCDLDHEPVFDGFGNLSSLYLQEVIASRKTLLHLLSNCPLLKSASLNIDISALQDSDDYTVIHLFQCLPEIENLSIGFGIIECFAQDGIPQELPIALVHLKYLCIKDICFIHNYGLPILLLLIKSSPNLQKLMLEILDDSWVEISERRDLFTLEDDSYIWLEHLNEFEMKNMIYRNVELDFVKLILAKSPLLKKVRIFLFNEVAKDAALHISETLTRSKHASPVVEVIVEIIEGSCPSSRSVM